MIHRRGSTEEEEEGGGISSGRREEDYYIDLIDELFGISAVVDYVGATSSLIAPIINGMLFGIAATPGARIPAVARRRMVDIAIYLQERARPYVCGEVSADEYASSCRREAHFVLQEGGRSGGEESTAALLWIIGTTLLEEADQHAGGAMVPMSFVRKTLLETTRRVRSTFSNARIYAPIYFRAALEGLALGGGGGGGGPGGDYGSSSTSLEDDNADDCSGVGGRNKKSNKERVDQDAVLDLLWQYVVNDSVATLQGACARVFTDRGGSGDTRGAGLAFLKTPPSPSLVKYQRADAVRILARELIAASTEVGERRKKSK